MAAKPFARLIVGGFICSAVTFGGIKSRGQATTQALAYPVVEAAVVIGDFVRNYDAAVEKYNSANFTLEGRVESVTTRKDDQGRAQSSAKIVSRESPSGITVPIVVWFDATLVEQASKMKPGDLVRIDITYMPYPATPTVTDLRGFMAEKVLILGPDNKGASVRDNLLTWIEKNSALKGKPGGREVDIVQFLTDRIDAGIKGGEDFQIAFGPAQTISKKGAILCVQDGRPVIVDLTAAQAAALEVPESEPAIHAAKSQAVRVPAEYELSKPVLEGDGAWDFKNPLKGKITVKALVPPRKVGGQHGLRLVVQANNYNATFYWANVSGPLGDREYDFNFSDYDRFLMNSIKDAPSSGTQLGFLQAARRTGGTGRPYAYEVLSDPIPIVLTMPKK